MWGLLERRLDNTAFRMGLSSSRDDARQLVRHGHLLINGHKCNIPSVLVKVGDVIEVREKSREKVRVVESLEAVDRRGIPGWIEMDRRAFKAKITAMPQRADITMPIEERLIVELYSK